MDKRFGRQRLESPNAGGGPSSRFSERFRRAKAELNRWVCGSCGTPAELDGAHEYLDVASGLRRASNSYLCVSCSMAERRARQGEVVAAVLREEGIRVGRGGSDD